MVPLKLGLIAGERDEKAGGGSFRDSQVSWVIANDDRRWSDFGPNQPHSEHDIGSRGTGRTDVMHLGRDHIIAWNKERRWDGIAGPCRFNDAVRGGVIPDHVRRRWEILTLDFLVVHVNHGPVVNQIGSGDSNESGISDIYVGPEIISDNRSRNRVRKSKDRVGQWQNDIVVGLPGKHTSTGRPRGIILGDIVPGIAKVAAALVIFPDSIGNANNVERECGDTQIGAPAGIGTKAVHDNDRKLRRVVQSSRGGGGIAGRSCARNQGTAPVPLIQERLGACGDDSKRGTLTGAYVGICWLRNDERRTTRELFKAKPRNRVSIRAIGGATWDGTLVLTADDQEYTVDSGIDVLPVDHITGGGVCPKVHCDLRWGKTSRKISGRQNESRMRI